jgi:hypothetical protein
MSNSRAYSELETQRLCIYDTSFAINFVAVSQSSRPWIVAKLMSQGACEIRNVRRDDATVSEVQP